MTDYAVAADEVGTHNHTAVAGDEDTVTFDRDCDSVEVVILDAAAAADAIYFTTDGTEATVEGENCYVVAGVIGASLEVEVRGAGDTVVRLISDGTPSFSVQGSPGGN